MKKIIFLSFVMILGGLYSCNNCSSDCATAVDCKDSSTAGSFIDVDSANKMIGSYLTSINYEQEDSNLRSLIVDVKALNQYVQCTKQKPAKIKLMFAHKLDYINSGHGGENAGYKRDALTLVVVPYDDSGNYIVKDGLFVMDRLQPCPSDCPSSGTASSDYILIHSSTHER